MTWTETFKLRLSNLFSGDAVPEYVGDDYDVGSIDAPDPAHSEPGQIGQLAIAAILFPLQVIFLPMRALGLFHASGVDLELEEDYQELSTWGKLIVWTKKILAGLLTLPYLIITAPIRFFRGFAVIQTWEILFITPALLMAVFIGYVCTQVFARSEIIKNRYSKGVSVAMAKGDYELAKIYFSRLILEDKLSQPQQLQRMIVLQETGEHEKAKEILDELAPEDNLGFDAAHQLKAIQLAAKVASGDIEADTLQRLGRHLSRTKDDAPKTLHAWTIYFKQLGQHDRAIEKLAKACETNPVLYLALANYQNQLGRQNDQIETLKKAAAAFRNVLEKEPFHQAARINLATVLARQGRIGDAETLLLDGFSKKPDIEIRQALAGFFSMRYDRSVAEKRPVKERLNYLVRALYFEPNHPQVYQRMMDLYQSDDKTEDDLLTIRLELQQIIASDKPSEIAHFVLSNVLWSEGEKKQAIFHLEQAYKLNPSFVFVANNLAWIMATENENPDLDRALELSQKAVDSNPDDARFRDTLGTILQMRENFSDAITEYNRALPGVAEPQLVHKKLSECYSALDMPELAKQHLANSQLEEYRP